MQRGKFNLDYEQTYLSAKMNGVEEQLDDELYSFARLIQDHYEFKLFLEDPRIAADYKKKCMKEISTPGVSVEFQAIVNNLIDNGREELVEDLSRNFTRMLFKDKGILFGEVLSAKEIAPGFRSGLRQVMEKIHKCPVRLRYAVDDSLIGGLCVRLINGEVWDLSLKHKLNDLKASVIRG